MRTGWEFRRCLLGRNTTSVGVYTAWSPKAGSLPRRRSGPLPGVAAKHPATHKGSVPAGIPARCAKGRAAGIPGLALRRRAWARERSARRSSGPVQHHFAALPRQHGIKPVLELAGAKAMRNDGRYRSEEHTSELQSLMRISYAV